MKDHTTFARKLGFVAGAGILLFCVAQANAATIVKDASTTVSVPGLTGFSTTGDMMDGMSVTATFAGGFSQTLAWADTGLGSGGVTGTGWSLTQSGTTFADLSWSFTNSGAGLLTGLVLDGTPGLTVFDTTFGGALGTPGSDAGKDFATDLIADAAVVATYSNVIAVGAAAPVGDLFHILSVDFTGLLAGGTEASFLMTQDTDNDSRFGQEVPAPATLALLGLGFVGIGYRRKPVRMA